MTSRSLRGLSLGWILVATCIAAACSASGVDDNQLAPTGAAGTTSAGGDTGASGDTGSSGATGTSGSSGSPASAGGSGGASATGGSGGGVAFGGSNGGSTSSGGTGPTTNAQCLPGVIPGAPTSTPIVVIGDGAQPDADKQFGGADDPSLAPTIVYPQDQTLVPTNLSTLEIHFMPAAGTSLFEIRFANQAIDFRLYSGCTSMGGGCVTQMDAGAWSMLSASARGTGPMAVTVRGVNASSPASVGTSPPIRFEIAPDPVLGGLYYWNAGASEVVRYDFGDPASVAEVFYSTKDGALCVGCHALSRKGGKMAVGLNAPIMPIPLRVVDVATKQQLWALDGASDSSAFETFSPDETEIVTAANGTLTLRDASNGAPKDPAIPPSTSGQPSMMPEYMPDASGIVYATGPCFFGQCNLMIGSGSIAFLPRTASGWGAEQILVPSGMNNFYPSVAPDSKWVLFNHSTSNAASDEAPDAALWVVPVGTGAQTPIQLARANGGNSPSFSNSWPKFAPFVGCNGNVMWFTFSSNRDYGLRIQNSGKDPKTQVWQLWMASFNHTKAMNGEDPSFTAFWLPFQDATTGNHIAQWVEKVARQPCQKDADCMSTTIAGGALVCNAGYCGPMMPK